MKQIRVVVRSTLWIAVTPFALLAPKLRKGILGLALMAILPCHLAAGAGIYALPIYSGTNAIAAIAYGAFDQAQPGNQLACLMGNGSIFELTLGPSGWTATNIFVFHGDVLPWQNPGTRVSLKIGSVLSEIAGKELVLSYYGRIFAIYHDPSIGWTNQIIADNSDFVGTSWDMDVGNCDPSHPGDEVFGIYETVYDFSTGTVYEKQDGIWDADVVYYAEVGMGAAIGHSNPDFPQNDVVVVTEMGPAYEIVPPATGGPGPWPMRTIWDDFVNAGWVVRIGDVYPQDPTNQIVYGTRYSDSIMVSQYNGTNSQNLNILYTGINTNVDNDNMWDVAIAQVFPATPASPDKQILGVDESGSVYVVQDVTNQWQGSILWQDTSPLYAVLPVDMLPTQGDEVVVAGASGTVTLLCDPAPVLNLASIAQGRSVISWTGITGVTYTIETTTNLQSGSSWNQLTNLTCQGAFSGGLSYTNVEADAASERFFQVKANW